MTLEIPMGDVNLDGGSYNSPLPGRYIGEVNAWGESEDKPDLYHADLEISFGSPDGQAGKTQRVFFNFGGDNPKAVGVNYARFIRYGVAVGLCTQAEAEAAKANGTSLKLDPEASIGKKLCFDVVKAKTKSGVSIDWGMYPVDSDEAKRLVNETAPDGDVQPPAEEEATPFDAIL